MKEKYIETIPELKKEIRKAKEVYAQIRFGTNEAWSRITKAAALDILKGFPKDAEAEDCEMFGSWFGSVDGDILYFG